MKKLLIAGMIIFILELIGCGNGTQLTFQGYVEGRFTYVAPDATGILKQLFVDRGFKVKSMQPLFVLDQRPESDLLAQAKKQVDEAMALKQQAEADLTLSKVTIERYQQLYQKRFIDKQTLDQTTSELNRNQARVAEKTAALANANANLDKVQWSLEQKTVFAPIDGEVYDTYYRIGELVTNGSPVLSILAPVDVKIVFYVREPVLSRVHVGDSLVFRSSKAQKNYHATVSFISPDAEYTPPVIFSTETTDKLLYRIEARMPPDIAVLQHPGQPVMVTLQKRKVS